MPSGRRPPPPPPKDNSDPAPPPLPSRSGSCGRKQQTQDDVDTYEQPTSQFSSDISIPDRGRDISTFSSSQSMPAAESSYSEDWSDDEEWEDIPNLDIPSTPQSDHTYLMPDGGMVLDNEYNVPDDIQTPTKMTKKPSVAARNGSREDKNSNFEPKPSAVTNMPKPPPNKPKTVGLSKPIPNPKPKGFKPSDPGLPKLPPRPTEKSSPSILTVPPLESKRDNILDSSTSTGSVSSDSVIGPPDTKTAAFQRMQKRTEKSDTSSSQGMTTQLDTIDTEIYDDGVTEVLSKFDWFHGELEREEGARRVKHLSENGAFLIRASKSDGTNNSHPYTLVVTLDQKVYNLKIRLRHDSRFAIGTYKPDEVSFSTVPELVEHHKENKIKLAEGGAVKLTHTPKK